MKHPWLIGAVFGLCLTVVLASMGWTTVTVLELEHSQQEAARRAELEEAVRLSLWRIDSLLAPLIAQENARPYFTYSAFYPAQRAYTTMFAEIQPGEVLIPSQLLASDSPDILLHFQIAPDGTVTSPQAPTGNMRDLAEAHYVDADRLERFTDRQQELSDLLRGVFLPQQLPERFLVMCATKPLEVPKSFVALPQVNLEPQQQRSSLEFQKRSQNYAQNGLIAKSVQFPVRSGQVEEGSLKPVWVGKALVLARRVAVEEKEYVQGCWLDWPVLREKLQAEIRDLLPHAEFHPVSESELKGDVNGSRLLATLPVRLEPGVSTSFAAPSSAPLRLSLWLAWTCALLAAASVAVLLIGALKLSERRGAFVSAVTHELRTPLTTFRLYSEMLAEDMITDPDQRRGYLETLRTEAERLGHLVENVLAYARLENGSFKGDADSEPLIRFLDDLESRLARHCEQAGMRLVFDDSLLLDCSVKVPRISLERILFNLIDNACKYAAKAEDKRVHLEFSDTAGILTVWVRDHGSGVAPSVRTRLFRPFSKSATVAANSAPGVGLGLALCRRLARQMGGDLRHEKNKTGACFVLEMPVH